MLFDKIQSEMYKAMKSGDKFKVGALRTTLAKLKDKKIEKRDDLTEHEEIKVLMTLVKQRKESVVLYEKGGRAELALAEKAEIDIINRYLPQMMDESEIKKIVIEVVDELGAKSMADLGKVMPKVMTRGKGLIDGKSAQIFVKEILSKVT